VAGIPQRVRLLLEMSAVGLEGSGSFVAAERVLTINKLRVSVLC